VRQPLTAIIANAEAGVGFLDRSTPSLDKAKEALRRIVADSRRAGEVVGSVRAVFRSDHKKTASLDVNEIIRDALVLERGDLQKNQISVQSSQARRCGKSTEIAFSCNRCFLT
jgi:C4-dicarboxylate-specific signal transduction histidine kinase